jgi:hypothetical protein
VSNSIDVRSVPCKIELEDVCWSCEGNGCESCDGTGYRPTEAGDAVLALVKRHLKRGVNHAE